MREAARSAVVEHFSQRATRPGAPVERVRTRDAELLDRLAE